MGKYIVDFYCDSARLPIELDGLSHILRSDLDTRRDAALSDLGVRILRIPNYIIHGDLDLITRWIADQITILSAE